MGVAPTQSVSKNKYVALAQKAQGKTAARQNRQKIAQNLSGEEELDQVAERTLTKPEKKKKEKVVKGMKKSKKDFKRRYGDDAESVMYATATKIAKEKG